MKKEKNEEINSKNSLKESIIEENELPFDLENNKKDMTENSISPIINDIKTDREQSKNNININNNKSIKKEQEQKQEQLDFESKKIKLVNIYHSLLKLRQSLIIKEKELNQKEKNLIEFENILKSNEAILKNNIEQFDIYIKNKIEKIKKQFNQIEQIQMKKENYLKLKEEEIIKFKNKYLINNDYKSFNDMNLKKIHNNIDIYNENFNDEPFINNYLDQNIFENKNKNIQYNEDNQNNNNFCENCSKYHYQINNNINNELKKHFNENNIKKRQLLNNLYNNINLGNYKCECPFCKFYGL